MAQFQRLPKVTEWCTCWHKAAWITSATAASHRPEAATHTMTGSALHELNEMGQGAPTAPLLHREVSVDVRHRVLHVD